MLDIAYPKVYRYAEVEESPSYDRTLYRVRHWYEYGRTFESNRPEVNRLEPFHFWSLTSSWQLFIRDVLAWSKFGVYEWMQLTTEQQAYIKNAFRGVMANDRAFTNGGFLGVDYVNMEEGDGSQNEAATIVCGGTCLSGEKVYLDSYPGLINGWYLQVHTLLASLPAPSIYDINPKLTPWYFTKATIATKTALPSGGLKVTNFPQLDYAPVYMPIVSHPGKGLVFFPFGGK